MIGIMEMVLAAGCIGGAATVASDVRIFGIAYMLAVLGAALATCSVIDMTSTF
jgi:hypothetical protein